MAVRRRAGFASARLVRARNASNAAARPRTSTERSL